MGLRRNGDEIQAAAAGFHVYYRLRGLGNGQYTVDCSPYIYARNPKGRFVEILTGDLPGHPQTPAQARQMTGRLPAKLKLLCAANAAGKAGIEHGLRRAIHPAAKALRLSNDSA